MIFRWNDYFTKKIEITNNVLFDLLFYAKFKIEIILLTSIVFIPQHLIQGI